MKKKFFSPKRTSPIELPPRLNWWKIKLIFNIIFYNFQHLHSQLQFCFFLPGRLWSTTAESQTIPYAFNYVPNLQRQIVHFGACKGLTISNQVFYHFQKLYAIKYQSSFIKTTNHTVQPIYFHRYCNNNWKFVQETSATY